jgi:hypothetical protein
MLRTYEEWDPRGAALDTIEKANEIIADFRSQGFDLTLRQLYYQFVAKGLLANTEANYKRLGEVLNRARLAGLVDWNAIVDRTRAANYRVHDDDPDALIQMLRYAYSVDRWADQPTRVEVWVEKEALAGIVSQVASELDVTSFACRGYVSASAMFRAAQRVGRYLEAGQDVVILHLGDHDPSGIDMTRDNEERLRTMLRVDWLESGHQSWDMPDVEVRRVALNMDQVRRYDPPPNPAKLTDSRAGGYTSRFGFSSWELDALDPTTLADLIRSNVEEVRDDRLYAAQVRDEEDVQSEFQELADAGWLAIREWLESWR